MAKKVNREIHKRKRVYYRRKFPAKNPRWWALVNENRDLGQNSFPDEKPANELNDVFYEVWGGIKQPDLSEYTNIICSPPSSELFTASNIKQKLGKLDGGASGPDGVSANLLKSAKLELNSLLANMLNSYLNLGLVPKQWLNVNIIPIDKIDYPSSWID